jgi:hypothetical protein
MAINDLHQIYPNRNSELRGVAKQLYEFGKTIAREPSAAHTNGLDQHAIKRQHSYIEHANSLVDALAASPIPDHPATHPTDLPIDFSEEYVYFSEDVNGNMVPLNEATQLLAEAWLICACEMAKSNSAAIAGSLVTFDAERAANNIAAIQKLLTEMEARPFIDLPETANPGSTHGKRSSSKK